MSRIGWNAWSSGSLLPSRDSTLYVLPFVVNRHRAHADSQCQWLVARIGDAPNQSEDLLDSLVAAAQKNVAQSCWDTLDREGLSAIE